jgi:multiple sugar transport system permease protein
VTLLIVIPVAIFAGYGLGRLPHASSYKIFALNFLIFSRIMPATSIALPYFVVFCSIGIYDTYIALIIVYILKALPLAIFMIMTFIEEVPIEIEESASIDGANTPYILTKIVVPLILPGAAATAVFAFIYTWNDYLFAAFLTGKNSANLQIAIAQFNAEYQIRWGELCSSTIIAIAPILFFTIVTQKYLVRGLTMGAVKR